MPFVEHRFGFGVLEYICLEVFFVRISGDAPKIPIGIDMAGDSGLLLHIQESSV